MASTTEELTGQSEQLVSALSFFRTGEEEEAVRRGKPVASVPAPAARVAKVAAAASRPGKAAGKGGVSLKLGEKHDALDGDFERY
jgi:methyl-accepting chemotaxis protein